MAESDKKPEIRFSGFTDDWEKCKLGDVYKFQYGQFNTNPSNGGKYPVYGANGIIGAYTKFNAESSVIIGHMGEYAGIVLWNEGKHFVTYNGIITTPKDKKINSRYGYYMLYKQNIREICGGSGQPFLSYEMLDKLKCDFPIDVAEQIKINELFSQMDNLITLHQRKYDKLVNIKKSMLEKMFPKKGSHIPEIRFSGFTDVWELRKLTDEVELFSGLTYSPSDIVKENGTFVLRSSNVKNGEVIDADNVYVNSDVVNSCNVKNGDIIVVVRNGSRSLIGKHAQIKGDRDFTVIGAFMSGLRSDHSNFINALLDTPMFKAEIDKNLGATINQITNGMFHQMEFMIPKPEEQDRIGEIFTGLDNLITLHQCKLEKLKNIKKSMLEKMFV